MVTQSIGDLGKHLLKESIVEEADNSQIPMTLGHVLVDLGQDKSHGRVEFVNSVLIDVAPLPPHGAKEGSDEQGSKVSTTAMLLKGVINFVGFLVIFLVLAPLVFVTAVESILDLLHVYFIRIIVVIVLLVLLQIFVVIILLILVLVFAVIIADMLVFHTRGGPITTKVRSLSLVHIKIHLAGVLILFLSTGEAPDQLGQTLR